MNTNIFLSYLKYALIKRQISLVCAVLAIIVLWLDIINYSGWFDNFNNTITISTLLVAIAVWFSELSQEWRNQLPKRLTVKFNYQRDSTSEPITVMQCEKAHLSDIADIRSLGQQIGSQLVNPDKPTQLSFRAPYVKQMEGIIEPLSKINFFRTDYVRHYTVTFTLTKLPEELKETECKYWTHPFDKKDIKLIPYDKSNHY